MALACAVTVKTSCEIKARQPARSLGMTTLGMTTLGMMISGVASMRAASFWRDESLTNANILPVRRRARQISKINEYLYEKKVFQIEASVSIPDRGTPM